MRPLSTFPIACPLCGEQFIFTVEVGALIPDPDPNPASRTHIAGVRCTAPAGWSAHVDQHLAEVQS